MGDTRRQPKSLARQAARYAPSAGIFGPTTGLDHRLFTAADGQFRLRGEARAVILERLDRCIRTDSGLAGSDWQGWTRVYLMGGSASEWAGDRPNDTAQDLDIIVAIDLREAQRHNAFEGMSAGEAASALNAAFWKHFNADNWHAPFGGIWNLTAFCNQRAWYVEDIRPYAAWDLMHDGWAVVPPHLPEHSIADFSPEVIAHARAVAAEARAILRMDEPLRTREATALWHHIREHRCQAFSPEGSGWDDPGNVDEKYLAYHPHRLLQKIKDLALGPRTAAGHSLRPKDEVDYRQGSNAEHCGNCVMIRDDADGGHRCTLVAGKIDPQAVCDEWSPGKTAKTGVAAASSQEYWIGHRPPGPGHTSQGGAPRASVPYHEAAGRDPGDLVDVYRAAPGHADAINPGDWVTLHGDWARERAESEPGYQVLHARVPARHVYLDAAERDDDEAGYHGPGIRAQAAAEGYLRNPYHGTPEFGGRPEWSHTWFHGTRGEPDFGTRRKYSEEAQRAALPPEQRVMNSGWTQPNQHLGVHFSPLHEVGHKFAPSTWSGPTSIAHVRLRGSNPAHFETEEHLNIAMADWASKHYPHWHNEKLNSSAAWNYSDQEGTHRDFSRVPDDPGQRWRMSQQAQSLLTFHPHMPEILAGFKAHLREQGHHGITYGNGVEGPYDTDATRGGEASTKAIRKHENWPRGAPKSISAIADPEDIEVTHVEHIAGWRKEPEGEQRTWEDVSDSDEPDEMRDRVLGWHREHGGQLPRRLASAPHYATQDGVQEDLVRHLAAETPSRDDQFAATSMAPRFEVLFEPDYHGRHRVSAWPHGYQGDTTYGEPLGSMQWHPQTGQVTQLHVRQVRQGIGTALWGRANEEAAKGLAATPVHSPSRTPAADAWAHAVGGEIPPLSEEARSPEWAASLGDDAQFRPKTASREEQLAAMDPQTRAAALAQEHVRLFHPKLTTPIQVRNGQSSVVLSTWLAQAGHPGAPVAYIAEHPNPGVMSSNTGRGPDGEPVVVLHPDRKDYGTLAHEAAHLIADHETGRRLGEPHGPDGAHDDRWAGHYARLLDNLSSGAGDEFLAERDYERSAMHHEASAGPGIPQRPKRTPGSAMVYLDVPHGAVQPHEGQETGHHIALAYLPRKIGDEAFGQVVERARQAAARHAPMKATISGGMIFPPGTPPDRRRASVVPVHAPGIHELHAEFGDFDRAHYEAYAPHVTRAQLGGHQADPEPHPEVSFPVTHLHVRRGDEVHSFPLTGPNRLEAALLDPKWREVQQMNGWTWDPTPRQVGKGYDSRPLWMRADSAVEEHLMSRSQHPGETGEEHRVRLRDAGRYRASQDPALLERYRDRALKGGPIGADPYAPKYDPDEIERHADEPIDWGHPVNRHEAVSGYDGLTGRTAMIYLELPPGTVRPVPGGVDDHHITLVYLGKNVSDEKWAQACRRVREAASQCPPMDGVLKGIDIFPPSASSDGKVPAFVPAYVGGIGRLRRMLEDLSASEHKDYRPHVTLAYMEEGDSLPAPHPAVPLRFTHLCVKRGDDVRRYPFGQEIAATAAYRQPPTLESWEARRQRVDRYLAQQPRETMSIPAKWGPHTPNYVAHGLIQEHDGPVRDEHWEHLPDEYVSLRQPIHTHQGFVYPETVRHYLRLDADPDQEDYREYTPGGDEPKIVRHQGTHYLLDGHHRYVKDRLMGHESMSAKVFDTSNPEHKQSNCYECHAEEAGNDYDHDSDECDTCQKHGWYV